jgi:hypothetical protein
MNESDEFTQEILEDLVAEGELVDLHVKTTRKGAKQIKITLRPPGYRERTLMCERLPDGTLNWLVPRFWPLTEKDTWQPFKGDDSAGYMRIAWLVARHLAAGELGSEA